MTIPRDAKRIILFGDINDMIAREYGRKGSLCEFMTGGKPDVEGLCQLVKAALYRQIFIIQHHKHQYDEYVARKKHE